MGILDIFRGRAGSAGRPRAEDRPGGIDFTGLDDPRLLDYIRNYGATGDRLDALRNTAALRCVSLICESIGMLPLNLLRSDASKAPATDHPAYRLLKLKPNSWQTPYEFKSWMQLQVLMHGNAYARVIWSAGRPIALVPIDALLVNPQFDRQRLVMRYEVTMPNGEAYALDGSAVLHIRDLSIDSIRGVARMQLTRGALDLARSIDDATANIFKTGVMAGGAIEVPTPLSDQAYARMKQSLADEYSGAASIRKWMLMEEGAKANQFSQSAVDAQLIAQRNQQIEEVARAFGVPRPLLMMDDTSWGSGIEQLGIFFVQYGLQHWMTAWEQAVMRVLLSRKTWT